MLLILRLAFCTVLSDIPASVAAFTISSLASSFPSDSKSSIERSACSVLAAVLVLVYKCGQAEIVTFIQNHLDHYTVSQLCSALKFPRSTYYKALVCVPSNRQKEYKEFGRKVKQAYDDSRQRYGAVKICRTLNDNGTPCSVKRVQRHMAKQGLRSVVVKNITTMQTTEPSQMIK